MGSVWGSLARVGALSLTLVGIGDITRARAGVISIDFGTGGSYQSPASQPGVVPGGNWNNVTGASGSNFSLVDSKGGTTTALLSFGASGAYGGFSGVDTSNSATNLLYTEGIFGSNISPEVSITLSNIPYAEYDVYVYASADTYATNTLSLTDGTTTYYYASNGSFNSSATSLLRTTSTNPSIPTVGPGQYQVFSNLDGSSVTFTTGGSITGVISNNVFGLQVTAVPEPSTWALMLVGLAGLAYAGYRRGDSARASSSAT